jgi:hypothetical protein
MRHVNARLVEADRERRWHSGGNELDASWVEVARRWHSGKAVFGGGTGSKAVSEVALGDTPRVGGRWHHTNKARNFDAFLGFKNVVVPAVVR